MIYLSDIFGNIPWILLDEFKHFLNFLYVHQSVCWLTSLLKGPSFGNLKDQRGLQDKPPGPVGYHYSPPATSPIISSAFALLENKELYILTNSHCLLFFNPLAESWKNLSILMLGL